MFGRQPASLPEAPAQTVTVQDGFIAEAWGMTPEGWALLTPELRTDYRDRVVYAPYFKAGN